MALRTDASSSTMATRAPGFCMAPPFGPSRSRCRVALRANIDAYRLRKHWPNIGFLAEPNQPGDASDTKLGHHAPAMHFDRLFRRSKNCGDLLVKLSGNDVPQHLSLPWREPTELAFGRTPPVPDLPRRG